MNKYFRYLKIQLQRTVKVYPVIIAFTIITSLVLMLLLNNMFLADSNSVRTSKINIGLVGDTTETYLDIGFIAVQELDSTKHYIDFTNYENESDAAAELKKGGLFGYIVIPDGFVESVADGENKKLTYVSDNSPAGLGPLLINELVKLMSDLVVEAQSSMYAFRDVGERAGIEAAVDDFAEALNLKYIAVTFDRESFYTVEFIGIGEGLRLTSYYFHAFLIILMMLWGMVCVILRVRTNMAMPRLMKFRGIGAVGQTVCDYLPFFLIIYIGALLLTVAMALLGSSIGMTPINRPSNVLEWLLFAVKLIPAVAVVSSLQYLLYEFCTNLISGVLVQLVATVGLGYASGFFYPLSSYPLTVQKFANFLPTRMAFNYTSTYFCNNDNQKSVIFCIIYTALFLLVSVFVRSARMRGDRQ